MKLICSLILLVIGIFLGRFGSDISGAIGNITMFVGIMMVLLALVEGTTAVIAIVDRIRSQEKIK